MLTGSWIIDNESVDERLDRYLVQQTHASRQTIQSLLQQGIVSIDGVSITRPAYRLKAGQQLTISPYTPPVLSSSPTLPPIQIVFEDPWLVVINKPIGWLSHPPHEVALPSVVTWAVSQWPSMLGVGPPYRSGIVHRLDQYTEGLMVLAKTPDALADMQALFRDRQIKKTYWALVQSNVLSDTLTITQPIMRSPKKRHTMMVHPDGKPAITEIKVLYRYGSMTLVEAQPLTGRTHQIRVHLGFIGHPIIGDPLYGTAGHHGGQLLQAGQLTFDHPMTHQPVTVSLPLSPRLQRHPLG